MVSDNIICIYLGTYCEMIFPTTHTSQYYYELHNTIIEFIGNPSISVMHNIMVHELYLNFIFAIDSILNLSKYMGF